MRQTSFSSSSTPWKRRSYTNEKKRSPPIRMMPPRLLNRRLDLRVECATSENAPPVKVNGTPHQFYASTCVKPFGYAPYIEFSHIQYSLFTSAPDLKQNIRKPQDTTKTYKFDTTINLLYWENKFQEMFIFATKLNHPNPEISFITTWRTNLTHLKCFRL